jgi:hypothetical protein
MKLSHKLKSLAHYCPALLTLHTWQQIQYIPETPPSRPLPLRFNQPCFCVALRRQLWQFIPPAAQVHFATVRPRQTQKHSFWSLCNFYIQHNRQSSFSILRQAPPPSPLSRFAGQVLQWVFIQTDPLPPFGIASLVKPLPAAETLWYFSVFQCFLWQPGNCEAVPVLLQLLKPGVTFFCKLLLFQKSFYI